MSKYSVALKNDLADNIREAIKYYEESITFGENIADAYKNLAFIYWILINDYGFVTEHKFNPQEDLFDKAFTGWKYILEIGKEKFPNDIEFDFWLKYMSHIMNGEQFTPDECADLLRKDNTNLIPYFFLQQYIRQFEDKIISLKKVLLNSPTQKNKYILSIITAALY